MKPDDRLTGEGGTAWLSIGALARATGVPVETLRTWESRYGFPRPQRKPSGHRLYPTAAVPRLRRIAQVLALGHRAGQVVGATDGVLDELLRAVPPAPGRGAAAAVSVPVTAADQASLRALVSRFDAAGLHQALVAEWARLGPIELLETRVAPLVREVGDAWERGELEVRHEHFLSERVSDVLAALRLPLEERASGPLVILATLPGEAHGLGLQMAAAALAAAGCRGILLGTETPVPQIAALARDTSARAVAVSVWRSTAGAAAAAQLRRLRAQLPRRVRLVVGGVGAPPGRAGIERLASLRELDAWGRGLALGRPPAG